MNTREKYIEAGIIRPNYYHLRSHGREMESKTVRETLIESGKVRPAPEGMPLPQVYREFLARWYSKPSRRWEGPRKRGGVWS